MRALIAQPKLRANDVEANVKSIFRALDLANKFDCEAVFLPEMSLTGYEMGPSLHLLELDHPILEAIGAESQQKRVELVMGCAVRNLGRNLNAAITFDSKGKARILAEKMRLFDFVGEGRYFHQGASPSTWPIAGATVAVNICFDLRFWNTMNYHSDSYPELLVNLASWPEQRMENYVALLRARSLDLSIPVVGVNRTGSDSRGNAFLPVECAFLPDGSTLELELIDESTSIVDLSPTNLEGRRLPFQVRQGT